jgi:hypothetical protein
MQRLGTLAKGRQVLGELVPQSIQIDSFASCRRAATNPPVAPQDDALRKSDCVQRNDRPVTVYLIM